MAIRKIVVEDNYSLKSEAVLHKKCEHIKKFDEDLKCLIFDLTETLHSIKNAVGLAAPQIGVLKRVAVVDLGEGTFVLINPEIIEKSDSSSEMLEGCLSYPGKWALVERPSHVKVKTFDEKGKVKQLEADDFLAKAFCHEMDHLDGIVFLDKAKKQLSDEEVEKLIEMDRAELKSEKEE